MLTRAEELYLLDEDTFITAQCYAMFVHLGICIAIFLNQIGGV